jgi:hypothetical protein
LDSVFGSLLYDIQFDTFVGEKLQCPFASTFGRCGASEFNQVGFRVPVEDEWYWRNEAFFAFECGVESVFDEAFAEIGDGIGVAMKLFGDVGIGNASVFVFIDGK